MATTQGKQRKKRFQRRTPAGAPPGTLVPDPSAARTRLRVMAFGPDALEETTLEDPEQLPALVQSHPVTWIDVVGLGDTQIIGRVGELFGLHPLALEDAIHVHQRGKVEAYPNHLFVVARTVQLNEHLESEQLGIFLGEKFVITLQETPEDCLDPVRERIRKDTSRIRQRGADYLAYSLLDAVVDHYFPVIEEYGERIEQLETDVVTAPKPEIVSRIHDVKRELLALRRAVWPQREALGALLRDDLGFISGDTRIYLRDCYDHSIQILELLETYREVAAGLLDVYLSSLSHRMNDIMRVLTVIATIFIPLTFIVGLYGMNFDPDVSPWDMPELRWYWGYPATLLGMLVLALAMLVQFRRRGWL